MPLPCGSHLSSALGTLPARFRKPRLLVVGCGDVGQRVLGQLAGRMSVRVVSSTPAKAGALRALGAKVLPANLDLPNSLRRLAGLAQRVLHLAPPPTDQFKPNATKDPRTLNLVRSLARRAPPGRVVYGSTTGVYGDCQGTHVTEARPTAPSTARAHRRVDAEAALRFAGRAHGMWPTVLRIPGIYATDREGGTPRARLERATPVLERQDDVFTNHIQADDLARACTLALWRGKPQRTINVCDDTTLLMGDYFDLAADLYGLPRPRRIPKTAAASELPLMLLSFMSESRRIDNTRMKRELRVRLTFPHVRDGLASGLDEPAA